MLKEPIVLRPEVPDIAPAVTVPLEERAGARRVYIRKADLEKYGYTVGCPVCDHLAAGLPRPQGQNHTEECRARIEERMVEEGGENAERSLRVFLKRTTV